MECFISFGSFHKYFFILFISIVFQILNEAIYGFNYYEKIFDDVTIFHNTGHEYFSKHILIHLIFSYLGVFIFSVPFFIYEVIPFKKRKRDKISILSHKYLGRKEKAINQYFWILLISFLWIVEEILFIFYSLVLGGLDFWFFELLIIIYLSKIMLHRRIYKHHILAMSINCFPLIIKYIFMVLSVKLEKNTSNSIYIRHLWIIPVGILIYSILALIRSFVNIKIKIMIDFKFISQFKVIMIYGLMGVIITSILCIFTSSFKCNLGDIQNYLCNVSENDSSEKYIDSFSVYHNIFQGYSSGDRSQIKIEIFVIILGGITFLINKYSFLKVIRGLCPVILVFSFPILFLFKKLLLIINTLIISKSFYIRDVTGIKKLKFIFDMIGDILSLISFLIYSEILELNFCRFNYDLKKKIMARYSDEFNEPLEPDPFYVHDDRRYLSDDGDDDDDILLD